MERRLRFNASALLILIGFFVLVWVGMSPRGGGAWFHAGEAVSTVIFLAGVGGILIASRSRPH